MATSSMPRPGRSSTYPNAAPTGPGESSWSGTSTRSSSGHQQPDRAERSLHVLRIAGVRAEQLIELVQQSTQRVTSGDDLAVRLRDPGLPPTFSSADDHARMTLAKIGRAHV